mmetsp:Transcript_7329/g.17887  ORF Transcript_7329/g.17887 Transcript_7329/m.17887 type:complete len:284 (+) Transcript_7329:177-1028(+)
MVFLFETLNWYAYPVFVGIHLGGESREDSFRLYECTSQFTRGSSSLNFRSINLKTDPSNTAYLRVHKTVDPLPNHKGLQDTQPSFLSTPLDSRTDASRRASTHESRSFSPSTPRTIACGGLGPGSFDFSSFSVNNPAFSTRNPVILNVERVLSRTALHVRHTASGSPGLYGTGRRLRPLPWQSAQNIPRQYMQSTFLILASLNFIPHCIQVRCILSFAVIPLSCLFWRKSRSFSFIVIFAERRGFCQCFEQSSPLFKYLPTLSRARLSTFVSISFPPEAKNRS